MSGFWSNNGPNAQAVVGYLGNRGPGWGNPPRHDGNQASNFLLCDGHVKSMMPNQVSSGWNPPSPNTAEDNGAATPAPPQTGVCTQNDFAEGTSSNQYLATFSGV
jgi:prepilin-type processing-associated H-X9-DG protein